MLLRLSSLSKIGWTGDEDFHVWTNFNHSFIKLSLLYAEWYHTLANRANRED